MAVTEDDFYFIVVRKEYMSFKNWPHIMKVGVEPDLKFHKGRPLIMNDVESHPCSTKWGAKMWAKSKIKEIVRKSNKPAVSPIVYDSRKD